MPRAQTNKDILDFAPSLPRPAVLCTLVSAAGSAPQEPGARMWVSAERLEGTLGGGRLEAEIAADARGLLGRRDVKPHLKEYVLCRELDQCCGGRVQVFFEPVLDRRRLHIFGGGHLGRSLAEALAGSPLALTVIDPRPDWGAQEGLPDGVGARCEDPLSYLRGRAWDADDAACVMTHSHELDFRLVRELLKLSAGYLGLVGSEHKARVFRSRLASAADDADACESAWKSRVRCPMGEPMPGKNPKVIALSIAQDVLREWGLR